MMKKTGLLRCAILAGSFGVLLSGIPADSQTTLDPALEKAIANYKKTEGEAQWYAYTERKKDRTFDSKGNLKQDSSDTFEIIFLEGAPYQKHMLHNDLPLQEKEQKAEDKKFSDVAQTRRNSKDSKDKKSLFNSQFHLQLPVTDVPTRFDVSSTGSEEIDGSNMWVFLAKPRTGPRGMKEFSRDGIAFEMKLWVDEQDNVFSKIEAKVVADGMRYESGSLLGYNWKKVNGDAWLPERYWFKGKVRYMMMDIPAETEQTYSDYKKFRVDTIVVTH